jgi:3-deoxy-D-manno-octulosonic-acid transferase
MRKSYSFLIYLLTPLVLLYLLLRGLRSNDYLKRWSERFARFDAPESTGGIVIHAASMGEVNAASALIRALGKRFPDLPLCITTLTPTGSERVHTLFGRTVFHVYAPLDLPGAVRRFYQRVRPRLLVVMETEIWPNLYHEAASRNIPIIIANARISQRSIRGYRRFRNLTAAALDHVTQIGAQSGADADRLIELGADERRVVTTGNLKFDVKLPVSLIEQGEAIRTAWGTDRMVLLAGSTHEGDEGPLLQAFGNLLETFPEALLVLVPRHPERFGRSAQLARALGLRVSLRSEGAACPRSTQCFLVDSVGELLLYYAACDVAFVGGSIDTLGGQNVLEPAGLGKPVVVGPHMFNFEEITRQLIDSGALLQVRDARELEHALLRLFNDPELRDRMGRAGRALVKGGQGALEHTLELVSTVLTRATG